MLEFIVPALQNLLTIENLIWINLGVFIGSVFAAIPGLTVILCIILFLPFTYQMTAIPGMMFLLGIYCAGGYGGSVSALAKAKGVTDVLFVNNLSAIRGSYQMGKLAGVK